MTMPILDRGTIDAVEYLKKQGFNLDFDQHVGGEYYVDVHQTISVVVCPGWFDDTHNIYHDEYHMSAVANIAAYIASQELPTVTEGDETRAVKVASLLLASYYHDSGHTLGAKEDIYNIELAIECLTREFEELGISKDSVLYKESCRLIRSTVFCRTQPRIPTDILEQIIMDADMLYMTVSKNSSGIFHNLLGERNNAIRRRGESNFIPVAQAYLEQLEFMSTVEYFTKTARDLFGQNYRRSMVDIRNTM